MAIFTNESDTRDGGEEMETVIGPSVKVEGNFDGKGNVIVEGTVQGSLKTAKSVRIGENAVIRADVEAENVHSAGTIKGNIKASGKVELTSTARVSGNIQTADLAIESGAQFSGKCVMQSGAAEDEPKQPSAKGKASSAQS